MTELNSRDSNFKRRTNAWGIDLNFQDALGKWRDTSPETVEAIQAAMGVDPSILGEPPGDSILIVRSGEELEIPTPVDVVLESGDIISFEHRLGRDLPTGYHWLHYSGREDPVRLIVSPGRCWLPESLRTWGWAVQLYAARSQTSWGIGDFADLNAMAAWSANELGAGMMLVNPLSAASPTKPQQPSPYYPTSRRFFNPLWLCIEWIPGATSDAVPKLDEIARAGRALNENRLIDRDKIFDLKMQALELLWLQFSGDAQFERFCSERAADLDHFALFCALAEHHGSGWHSWPAAYKDASASGIAQFVEEHADRIQFHKWLQWLLDQQLARASSHLGLMQDLPIGVDPDGADAWAWQDLLAKGVGVGAPPDEFNTQGQNWGLPPWIPHKLRDAGYRPFIETIRAAFRHAGGLRVDHVMGLFRLFWVPAGMQPSRGAYVRYNPEELLAVLALESERARAYVVGEDLGTLEEGAREKLDAHRVLSYRLLWFEKEPPETYPENALAAVTTHDLPTVAGLWTGWDLEKQRELELKPNDEGTRETRERLKDMTGLAEPVSIDEVVARTYQLLAQAPSRILTAALEDAAAVEERPNMPATMSDQYPNWSIALPHPIEQIAGSKLARGIGEALAGRSSSSPSATRKPVSQSGDG